MASIDFVWYDVFTDRRFTGNPLAVVPDAAGLDDAAMASIARELNLSETTFVLPAETPGTTHRVRIFTPGRELAFAGHPTVGTAIALAELAGGDDVDLVLGLGAGPTPVSVRRTASGASGGSVLRAGFVAPQLPRVRPSPVDEGALAALVGIGADDLDPAMPLHLADAGGTDFVVAQVRSLDVLARCEPAGRLPEVVGAYVVAPEGDGYRVRMFAPAVGVPEDPATGSAACAFAGSLAAHVARYAAEGTHDVLLRQGVEMGRPSELSSSFDVSDGAPTQVRLAGAAVRVLSGSLTVG